MQPLPLLWLFFCYAFLGWAAETAVAAIRRHRYEDRSALFGPLCVIYGLAAVLTTMVLGELVEDNWFFLFLGSAIFATVLEWVGGHILERLTHTRWWDYSHLPWNLDGYICLGASLVWGALGFVAVKWGNGLLLALLDLISAPVARVILLVLTVLLAVDVLATLLTLAGVIQRLPGMEAAGGRLDALAGRMGRWIVRQTERRVQKAHPGAQLSGREKREKSTAFAQGCGFYKIVLLFIIGAFLGDITETLFCRATAGVWMSRSSVVWGPFSIVWGLAMALATLLLYKYKDRSAMFLFWAGTLLGGAYEYLCSVFTEIVFGTVFWDYSAIPFNLGGRINLLFCFFWGFAAVVWFRAVYPRFSGWIEKIPMRLGKILTWCLLIFMIVNIAVSTLAMTRYTSRAAGKPAQAGWEEYMDAHYGDERMERIYPNAIHVEPKK